MKLTDALARRRWLLPLLAVVFLPGCATVRPVWPVPPAPQQVVSKPPEAPREIPSHGGPKRVVVSKSEQMLRAYDGGRIVFETRVSTGKEGKRTPNGSFRALSKERIHYSSLYENAPMPFSVQFSGNYFLHGYSSVPNLPASHGCIRLPLRAADRRPARQFYEWVTIGTPIRIIGRWQD